LPYLVTHEVPGISQSWASHLGHVRSHWLVTSPRWAGQQSVKWKQKRQFQRQRHSKDTEQSQSKQARNEVTAPVLLTKKLNLFSLCLCVCMLISALDNSKVKTVWGYTRIFWQRLCLSGYQCALEHLQRAAKALSASSVLLLRWFLSQPLQHIEFSHKTSPSLSRTLWRPYSTAEGIWTIESVDRSQLLGYAQAGTHEAHGLQQTARG